MPIPAEAEAGRTDVEPDEVEVRPEAETEIGLADFDAVDRNDVANEARFRRLMRSLEADSQRSFSPEERRIIANRHLGKDNSNAIDDSTNRLASKYDELFQEKSAVRRWLDKYLPKIGMIAASVSSSIILRSALHATGIGLGAGTITGAVVGSTFGGWRASRAEQKRQFGAKGIIEEYKAIKSNDTDENRIAEAITFLHKTLESKTFKGNAGDLLKLLVFYKSEVGANIRASKVEDVLEGLWADVYETADDPRLESVRQFQISAKIACWEAAKKGIWRGLLIGVGVGAVSDIIGGFAQHARLEAAKDQYLDQHYGWDNGQLHPHYDPSTASPADIPQDVHFQALNGGTGLGVEATPYGNALSSAVAVGIARGQLHVPQEYINQMVQEGNTYQDAIDQFTYNFNFAQGAEAMWHGKQVAFNIDGIQDLMNQAVHNGQVDYQNFAETLKHAGDYLAREYPTDYGGLHGHANILMQQAAEYAAHHSAEPAVQSVLHGAAIGAVAYKTGESAAKTAGGKNTEEQDRQTSGPPERGGDEPPPRPSSIETTGETATIAESAVATAVAEPSPVSPLVEAEEPPAPINWAEVFYANYRDFISKADKIMTAVQVHSWEEMPADIKTNLVSLLDFIYKYNEQGKRFQIRFADIYTGGALEYKIASSPGEDLPQLKFKTAAGEDEMIDLKEKGAMLRLRFYQREADDAADPQKFDLESLKDYRDEFDYDLIPRILAQDRRERQDASVMLERKPGQLLHATEDDLRPIEIIGVDKSNKRLIALLSNGKRRFINEATFNKIEGFNIYHWEEGGIDGDYTARLE